MAVKVNCGRIVNVLKNAEKDVFSAQDIKSALAKVGLASRSSILTYMGIDGYLHGFGFMVPVIGGWELTDECKKSTKVTVQISTALLTEDVIKALEKAMRPFEGVVEITHE